MNQAKLVLLDMDGTLLDDNKQIPNTFSDVFMKLKEKGIVVGVASGRPYKNLIPYFPELYKDMVFVCENGGYVVYKEEVIHKSKMNFDICSKVIKKIRTLEDCEVLLCGENATYYEVSREDLLVPSRIYYPNLVYVEDLCDVKEDILKMAVYDFIDSAIHVAPEFANFDGRLLCATSAKDWMDIMMKDTSKGNGIKHLCKRMNITLNECMAFGDELNDESMLRIVKYSYAMANAKQEIKNICRYTCESNNEQGVIKTLIREFEL